MLREALKYLSLGLSIIPVRPRGKEPLLPWTAFQKRRASEEEVREWFRKWPTANVGIVTGAISSIIVVDLDGPDGLASATRLGLKSTVTSITGRGKHLWYQQPGVILSNSVRIVPGIDIRSDGGYVLAPPSVHESGLRYRWVGNALGEMGRLPSMPTVFLSVPVPIASSKNEEGWIAKALEEMKDGNIDDTLFRICSSLRNSGYSMGDARAFLQPYADKTGAAEGHLQDKIDNVWARYERSTIRSIVPTNEAPNLGQLVLHSPTNADSIEQYKQCLLATNPDNGQVLSTGYPKFDALSKGLKAGEVLTIAARTGVGKTNFIIGPIRTFCEAGKRVLLFSTEMSFDQIWQRYIATLADAERFSRHQFTICDEFTPDITRIEEAIRHVNPDLFVFDHISHIGTDYHIISAFMGNIKRLSRLFNIPAIVTAQLNRNADWVENGERVTPRMSMIQGSGAIEQMSAQVLLLSEKRVYPDYTEIDGVIDKNRHGDKGLIKFALRKNPYRVEEL
jgi:KaiC/GvpD/RAD55 family RecA-like ATPase